MKKVWLILLAVVLVFSMAFVIGCKGDSDGDDDGSGTDEDDGLVETVVFDMATDEGIQALALGEIVIGDDESAPNPLKPLMPAGNTAQHLKLEIVDNAGKKAIKITTKDSWGVGLDLRFAEFGFRAGDKITVTGNIDTLAAGRTQINVNVGSENSIADHKTAGAFTLEATLTAQNVKQIEEGKPAGVRLENRATGMVTTYTNITVVGMRPATMATLAAPVIEADATGIKWAAVEGASGYEIFADTTSLGKVGPDVLTFRLKETDIIAPGTYAITVVALGVANVSKDSPASNVLSVQVTAPPPPPAITFKIDATEQTQDFVARGGVITPNATDTGYNFVRNGRAGSYVYFKVDFGTGKDLTSISSVTFKFEPNSGDTDYKNYHLMVSETAFTGNMPGAFTDPANVTRPAFDNWVWGNENDGFNSDGFPAKLYKHQPSTQVHGAGNYTLWIDATKAAAFTGKQVVYVSLYTAADAGADVDIEDIVFVSGSNTDTVINSISITDMAPEADEEALYANKGRWDGVPTVGYVLSYEWYTGDDPETAVPVAKNEALEFETGITYIAKIYVVLVPGFKLKSGFAASDITITGAATNGITYTPNATYAEASQDVIGVITVVFDEL